MRQQTRHQAEIAPDTLRTVMNELAIEALDFVPSTRVADMVCHWLPPSVGLEDGETQARALADALGLASDLALFTPASSGMTAIDRLARKRKSSDPAERAAIEALRLARFRVMRIEEREDEQALRLRDIVSGEALRVADEHIASSYAGLNLVGRAAPLGDDTYALIGAITPLDEAACEVALRFRRPDGQGLSSPQRCAEAVYRHVVRHGTLDIPGLNRASDNDRPGDELPFGPEDSELDAIAFDWAELDASTAPTAESVQRVRDSTGLDIVLNSLAASVMAREYHRDRLADAYAKVAAIQIDTIRLRQANGVSNGSLATLSAVIDRAIADLGAPPAIRTLFEDLQRRAEPGASAADTDLERLMQRIRGLRAKTVAHGCTEQEALAAAEKVAELLDRYGLSLSEIELRQQECQGVGVETGRRRLGPIDDCVPAIAAFFDCRVWAEKPASGQIRHIFFGLRPDVEAAHYLYDLIELAFATETAGFTSGTLYRELVSGERRSATNSFQLGLARGIIAKLELLRDQRDAALRASSGRELVLVKTSLIEDELAKLGLHFRAHGRASKRRVLTDAYAAGQQAGERFDYRPALAAAR